MYCSWYNSGYGFDQSYLRMIKVQYGGRYHWITPYRRVLALVLAQTNVSIMG